MPFLVDSVTRLPRPARPRHPPGDPPAARRTPDVAGELREVAARTTSGARHRRLRVVESWMHVEIDRSQRRDDAGPLVATCCARCSATSARRSRTGRRCATRRCACADEIAADPAARCPTPRSAEAWELLRWLADDHFTFLGYREYDLAGAATARTCLASRGPARARHPALRPATFGVVRLAAAARCAAKAREPQTAGADQGQLAARPCTARPTSTTSGSRRSTPTARSSASAGSSGCSPSVVVQRERPAHPGAAAQGQGGAGRPRVRADSHGGKDLDQILETYPRDELFQIIGRRAARRSRWRSCTCRSAGRSGCSCARDVYGRFVSCLVYLPRDRYTTEVRLEMERILREAFGGDVRRLHRADVSESVLARLHFVVRVPTGDVAARRRRRRARGAAGRGHAVAGTTTSPTRSIEQCGEEAGTPAAAQPTATRSPRRTRRTSPPGPRSPTSSGWRRSTRSPTSALNLYEPVGAEPGRAAVQDLPLRRRRSRCREVLPILQRMGVEVVDERPYEIERADGEPLWIYDFGLRYAAGRRQPGDERQGPASRRRSPRPGPARPSPTASTRWCCAPG